MVAEVKAIAKVKVILLSLKFPELREKEYISLLQQKIRNVDDKGIVNIVFV